MRFSRCFLVLFAFTFAACSTTTNQPQPQPAPFQAPAPPLQPLASAACPPSGPQMKLLAVQPREKHAANHVGPDALYPNPDLTPGLAATLKVSDLTKEYSDHCPAHKTTCTYSQDHRDVNRAAHVEVYDKYNVPDSERNIRHGEVDHFWPLCAGGSNDERNLWYQPKENEWNGENLGFKEKDWLEAEICKKIKAGDLDPQEAYDKLTADWVAYYHEMRKDSDEKVVDRDDE
jgi:hypothetical protein